MTIETLGDRRLHLPDIERLFHDGTYDVAIRRPKLPPDRAHDDDALNAVGRTELEFVENVEACNLGHHQIEDHNAVPTLR